MFQTFDDSSIIGYVREMREQFRTALVSHSEGYCITIHSREEFLFHFEMLGKLFDALPDGTE